MRLVVDSWDPDFGTPDGAGFEDAKVALNLDIEVPLELWAPRSPAAQTPIPTCVVFIDGVRRVEARVWVSGDGSAPNEPGLAASWGAGAVCCRAGTAGVKEIEIGRSLVTASFEAEDLHIGTEVFRVRGAKDETPDQLSLALQDAMGDAERRVADTMRLRLHLLRPMDAR